MSLNKDLEDRIKKESKILTRVNKKLESRLSIYKGSKDELKLYIDYVKFFSTWRGFVHALELTRTTKKSIVDKCVERIKTEYGPYKGYYINVTREVMQNELNKYKGYDTDETRRIFQIVLKAYDKYIQSTRPD